MRLLFISFVLLFLQLQCHRVSGQKFEELQKNIFSTICDELVDHAVDDLTVADILAAIGKPTSSTKAPTTTTKKPTTKKPAKECPLLTLADNPEKVEMLEKLLFVLLKIKTKPAGTTQKPTTTKKPTTKPTTKAPTPKPKEESENLAAVLAVVGKSLVDAINDLKNATLSGIQDMKNANNQQMQQLKDMVSATLDEVREQREKKNTQAKCKPGYVDQLLGNMCNPRCHYPGYYPSPGYPYMQYIRLTPNDSPTDFKELKTSLFKGLLGESKP
ncbi:uncharacterized protein LOC115623939 [Scaptodrosophila lebanonensis]|uniref:Uncharacterized protein LOC115623939 n=1 Tax=Drosophila lebanonensis TaxID=7225 RepID=A0A6J2TC42_DROLE|nr:uncharacterized protein LOC115623939 [Scaptodrosophila lebanonensis]